MKRRQFLAGSAGALVAGSVLAPAVAQAPTVRFALTIRGRLVELVDGTDVFMLAFAGASAASTVPGPVLRVREGDLVEVAVFNDTGEPHEFAVPGIAGAATGTIPPGQRRTATFTAPFGGSYLYLDPSRAPVNRVLGLHGALIVSPREGRTTNGSATPYSRARHTPALAEMFDALGGRYFPGNGWRPDDPEREKIWLFHQIDPRFNDMAARGIVIDPVDMVERFLPRYFTINGVSGFDIGEDRSVVARGYVGQPTLIRTMNAGLITHSPHIHGNDVHELSGADPSGAVAVAGNVIPRDAWMLPPLARKDMLLPFAQPDSIPVAVYPMREEPFPLRYVMHCHTEMSQTAGGGNYPQGCVTHWELLGPLQV